MTHRCAAYHGRVRGWSRLSLSAVLFLGGSVAVAGCGGGKAAVSTDASTATAANAPTIAVASVLPLVPLRTQRAIKRSAPAYAYVPTRMLVGYRYSQWKLERSGGGGQFVTLWFHRRTWPDVAFTAGSKQYNCPGGRTVWAHGGKIYWSGNNENDQYAWVCVTGRKSHIVQLVVDAAPQGKGGPSVASLATILHSGHAIR